MVKGMVHMINPFIEAFNNRMKLPKYVIWIPDVDILHQIDASRNDGIFIQQCIDWLLCNIENLTSRREFQLFDTRPGALLAGSPKFIWVKVLKRKEEHIDSEPIFSFRNKFNNSLEATLAQGKSKYEHLILSIDVGGEYDLFGNLNNSGKQRFWSELNSCMQKFELHQINLKPKSKTKDKSR